MKNKIFIILVFLSIKSIAQTAFIDKKPTNEIAAVEFPEFTKSIVFFGKKDTIKLYYKHKTAENEVNNYFGRAYDKFAIINILDKNVAIFNNQEISVFYKPNAAQEYGMIISDGKDKPIIVYEPENYLTTIKRFLEITSANQVVPKRKTERKENNYLSEMRQIMDLESNPDSEYAKLLINNSNTVHYQTPQKDDFDCKFTNRKFEIFQDESMTLKAAYGANYLYDKNNRLIEQQNTINDSVVNLVKFQRDQFGLITHLRDEKMFVTALFIYQKNKFYVVYLEDEEPIYYETFYLNDKKQCTKRKSFRDDKSVVTDIKYFYDDFGRISREIDAKSEKNYKYSNNTNTYYSELLWYDLNPKKLQTKYEVKREKNKNYFTEKDDYGKITSKSTTITDKNCNTKTISYDADNKIKSIAVFTSLEKKVK